MRGRRWQRRKPRRRWREVTLPLLTNSELRAALNQVIGRMGVALVSKEFL